MKLFLEIAGGIILVGSLFFAYSLCAISSQCSRIEERRFHV